MASIGLVFAAALAAASGPVLGSGPAAAPPAATSKPTLSVTTTSLAAPAPNDGCCADPLLTPAPNGERPLSITIESGLTVGRLGLKGHADGDATIDPQTGAKELGANMIDLGGLSFQGKATITGQPLHPVRIELPHTVVLHSPSGAEAELRDFRTDLPPVAMIGADGRLQFNFGATISTKNAQGGNFRGRIPIRVEYY